MCLFDFGTAPPYLRVRRFWAFGLLSGGSVFFTKFQYGRLLFLLMFFSLMKVGVCIIDKIEVPVKTTRRPQTYFPITHAHQEW